MYTVILAGSDKGALEAGTGPGPDYILEHLPIASSDNVHRVVRIEVPEAQLPRGSQPEIVQFIAELNAAIKKEVEQAISEGYTPIVFHGDDSLIMGTGLGLLDSNINYGLIYFDAHGDIHTPETSISGFLFGMGIAHLIGMGFESILNLNRSKNQLNPGNIRFVGTRNLDPGEVDYIHQQQIPVITPDDIRNDIDRAIEKISIKHTDGVYIHIDQDVIDPPLSGASLCQEPNGMLPEELYTMLEHIKRTHPIKGISFGNYKPDIDTEHKTLNIIAACLNILEVL